MNVKKSSLQVSGRFGVEKLLLAKGAMPKFKFLGFQLQWTKGLNGKLRPRVRPRNDRLQGTLKRIRQFLKENLNHPNHNFSDFVWKSVKCCTGGSIEEGFNGVRIRERTALIGIAIF